MLVEYLPPELGIQQGTGARGQADSNPPAGQVGPVGITKTDKAR